MVQGIVLSSRRKCFIIFCSSIFLLLSLHFGSAEFWACFSKGERINYCNSAIPDRTCTSSFGCQYCMSNYDSLRRCYTPGNFNICNNIAQSCESSDGIEDISDFESTDNENNDYSQNNTNTNPKSPEIALVTPSPGYHTAGTAELYFKYYILNDINLQFCELIVNNFVIAIDESPSTEVINTFERSLSPGSYSWTIRCIASLGDIGTAPPRSFTISSSESVSNQNQEENYNNESSPVDSSVTRIAPRISAGTITGSQNAPSTSSTANKSSDSKSEGIAAAMQESKQSIIPLIIVLDIGIIFSLGYLCRRRKLF
jgi:hypothetical protein